jgi:hypothetical protein
LEPHRAEPAVLTAEALIIDLLAPLLADSRSPSDTLELFFEAGSLAVALNDGVLIELRPVAGRTRDRYAARLQEVTRPFLHRFLPARMLDLLERGPADGLSVTRMAELLREEISWVTRDLLRTEMISPLEEGGWIDRGYCRLRRLPEVPPPEESPASRLADAWRDLVSGMMGYLDQQPAAVVGLAGLVTPPERLTALGAALAADLREALRRFDASEAPSEERVRLTVHLMVGASRNPGVFGRATSEAVSPDEPPRVFEQARTPSDEVGAASDEAGAASDEVGAASDEVGAASDEAGAASDEAGAASDEAGAASDEAGAASEERWLEHNTALLNTYALPAAAAAYRLLKNPVRADRALKWALCKLLRNRYPGPRGGYELAALRQRGLYWKLCARWEERGTILIGRKTRTMVESPEATPGLVEQLALFELARAYPAPVAESVLWETLRGRAPDIGFAEFQTLLLRLAQHGLAVPSRPDGVRSYQAPRAHTKARAEEMWRRWEKLSAWLPEFHRLGEACLEGARGARSDKLVFVMRRGDLAAVQEEIQATVERRVRTWSDLEMNTHSADACCDGRVLLFTRQEQCILDNGWEDE